MLSLWSTPLIIDLFYSYAFIFLSCSRRYYLSNIHYYKVHVVLYLIENIIFQPEPKREGREEEEKEEISIPVLSCEQTLLIKHIPRVSENIFIFQPQRKTKEKPKLSCEEILLINHIPWVGEIINVEYIPGVDIYNVVLKMIEQHIC
ncbi:hypothetical protein TCON_2838 [Astathelohania contejeani]|uniref:Uncharacterized protein n=1 Tax=Astathelohania contejeani TaxID=164912 RepID=A0ABQ7HUW6_9MICR|nr:hypothetical protein TCON_2838 [Thelohania contejeani]